MNNINTEGLMRDYIREFNRTDEECAMQAIPNDHAEEWLAARVPRVAVPDKDIERTYYFRWWTYRKHIKSTPEGYVVTEFHPDVEWAGRYNTIPCAVTHHIREGRWLRDNSFLDDYIRFWYSDGGEHLHDYSNALEAAIGWLADVRGDDTGADIVESMEKSYLKWRNERLGEKGLYWSDDNRDGSEFSVSGPGLRPTLNSYQYAGAVAISEIWERIGNKAKAERYAAEAAELKKRINTLLWDEELGFYVTLPQKDARALPYYDEKRHARELFGYLPWLFGAAETGKARAFAHLKDADGFYAPYGPTTVERRHSCYGVFYTGRELNDWLISRGDAPCGEEGHECLWNGPSWPFATSLMLSALADLLTSGEKQCVVTAKDYLDILHIYAASHVRTREDGTVIPWIDENIDPDTGNWISRTRLMNWNDERFPGYKGGYERGKDYNHSTFCDNVLEGLFGIRPTHNGLRIAPLFPATWEYAVLEDVSVHGHSYSVLYDHEKGYRVVRDGIEVFSSERPENYYEENADRP